MPRRYDDDPRNLDRLGLVERRPDERPRERPNPEEREKKSWREIDQKRDGSQHRREDRPQRQGQGGRPESQAYRAYKSQLDKLFSGGPTPEALKNRMEEAGIGLENKAMKEKLNAIVNATSSEEKVEALRIYRAAHGFPRDEAALGALLDLNEPRIVIDALGAIGDLAKDSKLKRAASLKGRIQAAKMTLDDPEVTRTADEILRLL